MLDKIELVIVTGMSGAGKSVAMRSLEDLGYYCIDNMPPAILPAFWDLIKETGKINKVALVVDLRTREFFEDLEQAIISIENTQLITTRILFVDADDATLVNRFKETRRAHPLADDERLLIGIQRERELLQPLRARAQVIIDTSNTSPRQLRERIYQEFKETNQSTFRIEVMSFGFKYGTPIDADIMFDVRFLPNPFYIEELKWLTGEDQSVYDYVMQQTETQMFYTKFIDLVNFCLPGYKKEGKAVVTIAIGCTGGKHRSVSLARKLANDLLIENYDVNVSHRDITKGKEKRKQND